MRDQQLFMAYHAPWGEVDEKNVSLFPIKTEWQNMEQKRISLVISDDIHRVCPDFVGAALWAEVSNGGSASGLLQEMEEAERQLQERMDTERQGFACNSGYTGGLQGLRKRPQSLSAGRGATGPSGD